MPPATIYDASPRPFPQRIEPTVYQDDMEVRCVRASGQIKWRGKDVRVTDALKGDIIGLQPVDDGLWTVYYRFVKLGTFDERKMRIMPEGRKKTKRKL